jgi:hypothetical protein
MLRLQWLLCHGSLYLALPLTAAKAQNQTPNAEAHHHSENRMAAPEVTAAKIRPIKTRVGEHCPANFTLYGTITTNGKTTVEYTWVSSDGKKWPTRNLKFTAAGSKQVTESWELGEPGKKVDQWVALKIVSPNRLTGPRMTLDFTCGAGRRSPKK